jgi:hypothetical protein
VWLRQAILKRAFEGKLVAQRAEGVPLESHIEEGKASSKMANDAAYKQG